MALNATSKPAISFTLTITETSYMNSQVTESTIGGKSDLTFTNGDGTGQINMGSAISGNLPSGGVTSYDFTSFPKAVFGSSINLDFSSGIKGITVVNNYNIPTGSGGIPMAVADLPYINVNATGSNAFTELFNGESGNIKINPQGSWTFVDFVGRFPTASNKLVHLVDSGSGVPYEITIIGVTG